MHLINYLQYIYDALFEEEVTFHVGTMELNGAVNMY